jgi:hypothetical protein
MVFDGFLLSPLGLLALLAVVPVVVLYLIRPEPEELELPTLRFLSERRQQSSTSPILERLRRNVLLFVQLLVIALLALSLATPYVPVSEGFAVEETVLVVDGSASMATESGGETRFRRALSTAREEVTGTTSVVYAAANGRVLVNGGTRGDAERALDGLAVSDTDGDLRAALSQAAAIAGEEARIVVLSDFADDTDWRGEVAAARARGIRVDLRQFGGGGDDNVGVVDRSFAGDNVTVSVRNFGDEAVERTLTLGDQRRQLDLAAGDVATATFRVPPGASTVRLTPGDSFPTDDVAYLSAPSDAAIDVLVVTNDENRYLTAALSVVDAVELSVLEPPDAITGQYDVVVYSNVDPDRLLAGNVEAGRDVVADGGGVAIQAQPNMPVEKYGDLLLVDPGSVRSPPALAPVDPTPLTRGITFTLPEEYVAASLREGTAPVRVSDGSPLVATAARGGGRILYYGYVEDSSSFKFAFQYPVFWKRAVFELAGREPLPTLNRETGGTLDFGGETTVRTPDGDVSAARVPLDSVGHYGTGERQYGVSLYSVSESDVAAPDLTDDGPGAVRTREERRTVPYPLSWIVGLVAGVVGVCELLYLRRRGDL